MNIRFAKKPAAMALSVALAQLFAAQAVMAQSAPAAGIEEVIVTAQKRKENLQDVPISIQALGAKDLEKHNIVTLSDLGAEVPGLNLAPYPGSSEIFFPTFRGITTNAVFISEASPIAVHVDGVFLSQLVGLNNPAADLERIEVLKGPQGVMSGRNATGGAINIYTARPELGQLGFKQQFTFAERNQFLSKTVLNVPMGEAFAAKFSYLRHQKDSDGITNSAPGGVKFGELDGDAWRIDLRWKATDKVMVDYGYDATDSKGYDTPPQCLVPAQTSPASDPRVANFIAGCSKSRLVNLYVPFAYEKNRNKTEGHTLNINWEVSPALAIRSITGYRKVNTVNHFNYGAYAGAADVRADSLPLTVTGTGVGTGLKLGNPIRLFNEAWSQEFQFIGDIAQNLKYTSGIYFANEKGQQSSGPNIGIYEPGLMQGADLLMIDNKGLTSAKNNSWAVFGQLTWTPDILDKKLDVVPGLRFTRDHREVVGYNTGWDNMYIVVPNGPASAMSVANPVPTGTAAFSGIAGDRSWSKTTPALSLNYRVQKDLMTYVKYSEAYTSGGFDPVAGPGIASKFPLGFNPEKIKSFEMGMKGEFLERRLRTNAALFHSKFKDEQKSVNNGMNGWTTVNVGGSTYQGFELDLTAVLTENLRLGLNYAALNHKYDEWIDPTTGANVTNLRKLVVPKNDYAINADYRFPNFGLPGKLDANLNYTHRDHTSTPLNLSVPNVETYSTTPAYGLWNARLALSQLKTIPGDQGRVTLAVWAKNITNKQYMTIVNQGWVTASSAYWGEPRTVGMDVIYKY